MTHSTTDTFEHWEALLAREGMPSDLPPGNKLWLNPVEAESLTTQEHVDGKVWAAGPDEMEVARFEQLTAWLPVQDLVLLALARCGQPQSQIASQLGVTQPAVSVRLHKARQRLRALDGLDSIPWGRGDLAASIAEHWDNPTSRVMTPARAAALAVKTTETWCVTIAAEGLGVTEWSARVALDSLMLNESPRLASCVALLKVVREHPLRCYPARRALSTRLG